MCRAGMHMKYPRAGCLVDLPAFQKVVNLIIGDAIGFLIRTERNKVLEIGSRNLTDQFLRRA